MLSPALYSILAAFALFSVVLSSAITTYTDGKCTKSFSNLDAVNGYPDGVCTALEFGTVQAFQIAKLDGGCAVTLYGPNEGPLACSSSLKIVADFATCYNSSWAYYSIDGCTPPSSSSIILPSATPEPSLSTASPSPTFASAAATSSAKPLSGPKSSNTGVIVGGIVGGVAVLALILGIVLFCLRRRPKPLPPPPSYELSNEHALLEAANAGVERPEKVARIEMFSHDAAAEIGRNSIYVPPVELPGDSVVDGDKKGVNPLIKIHMVR